ncbi:spore protease YyaC [Paenibacillus ginsengihumi]|uniref:spore protease YyaC n=1 Tax=Paenibacillus ginsengihumi TaxID=431596 RepID=UPI0003768AF8|nr:spore protease YyaC [Paenibacillus ginsengihumi]
MDDIGQNNGSWSQEPGSWHWDANGKTEDLAIRGIVAEKLKEIVGDAILSERTPVFLCIGSDRYVGDSLGPLVGTMLAESGFSFPVYGTLAEPIHAFNLKGTLKEIRKQYKKPFIIGIDALVGEKEEVGHVIFKEGPLTPGKALEKILPQVGDCHFVGVVNYIDPLPASQFLNDTRLYTVMTLAKAIVSVIVKV